MWVGMGGWVRDEGMGDGGWDGMGGMERGVGLGQVSIAL